MFYGLRMLQLCDDQYGTWSGGKFVRRIPINAPLPGGQTAAVGGYPKKFCYLKSKVNKQINSVDSPLRIWFLHCLCTLYEFTQDGESRNTFDCATSEQFVSREILRFVLSHSYLVRNADEEDRAWRLGTVRYREVNALQGTPLLIDTVENVLRNQMGFTLDDLVLCSLIC